MSKLLSLYKLCPVNKDILGVSADADPNSVICTLGKKIVYVIELSTQKNTKSWSSLDNFSSKVIYDFKRKQYVGVFSNIYLRFWDSEDDDINKVKKIKFHKPIHEIFNVSDDENVLVVYEDGTTESLDCALESKKRSEKDKTLKTTNFTIESTQMGNYLFSFIKKVKEERFFCLTSLDNMTLAPLHSYKEIKLERVGLDVRLMGLTTTYSKNGSSHLITIWSDKRMFKLDLALVDKSASIGVFHTLIEFINVRDAIAVRAISENCIAIYANNYNEDGSSIILYNMKYKVVQSKLAFKVYLSNFRLWSVKENLYLSMAQHLSVIPFVVTTDKLSSMIGSQTHMMENVVEKEMVNEDAPFENAIEFDENQEEVKGMEFALDESSARHSKKKNLSGAKNVADSDEVRDSLDQIYRGDLVVDLLRIDEQPENFATIKLLNNVDESFPLLSENFEIYCMHLERYGCSEIEITTKVVPILLKTNRTEDIGLLLKRYSHISERMLVQIVKYLLSCPAFNDDTMDVDMSNENEEASTDVKSVALVDGRKKYKEKNVFLNTKQNENRDVLSIALCCAFDSTTILKYLSSDITLNEMIQLMDHLYKILTTDVLEDEYDMRGNLVEGDDFDLDSKLFEWFKLLLDSHYQQILLAKDERLLEKLSKWLELVDDHVKILSQMKDMRYALVKIANNKPIQLSRKCSRWYTIEKLELY